MVWHRQTRERGHPPASDPVVCDARGVPVGVRIASLERHDEETAASRYLLRVAGLRKTRELEGRYWLTLGLY
jgi:hypothetical protein